MRELLKWGVHVVKMGCTCIKVGTYVGIILFIILFLLFCSLPSMFLGGEERGRRGEGEGEERRSALLETGGEGDRGEERRGAERKSAMSKTEGTEGEGRGLTIPSADMDLAAHRQPPGECLSVECVESLTVISRCACSVCAFCINYGTKHSLAHWPCFLFGGKCRECLSASRPREETERGVEI